MTYPNANGRGLKEKVNHGGDEPIDEPRHPVITTESDRPI